MVVGCLDSPTSSWGKRTSRRDTVVPMAHAVDLSQQDEREIREVLLRYAGGIDRRDWSAFATCFADDFVGDYGSFGCWTGAQQITEQMRAMHTPLGPTLHRLSNIQIWQQEGVTRSRTYVDALLMPAEAGGDPRQGVGYYDDEWGRTSGGWKIRRRRFTSVRLT
jgi:3-phenylpropionate/cinnamic acid dioxygenase small subunit